VPFRLIWPDKRGGFYKSIQHHLKDLLLKDGVYERREPIETYSLAEDGYLGPLEGTNENSNLLLRQYFPRAPNCLPILKRSSTRSRCA
jgi:hypothetical protein